MTGTAPRLLLAGGALCAALALLSPPADAVTSTTQIPDHPSVMAQPDSGKPIRDLAVQDGRLLLAYGDYQNNTGPIDVAAVDLATGATSVLLDNAPTEETNTFRRTSTGALVTPWIDPTGCGTCTPVNGGMSAGGAWADVHAFPAGHVYDYADAATSQFLVGAVAYGGAGVWQSVSGGPWRLVVTEESAGGATGWERFYWAVNLGGKVYAQAMHKGYSTGCGCSSSEPFRLRVWDGASWRSKKSVPIDVRQASDMEVFKGRAYFQRSVFDGTRVRSSGVPFYATDWFSTGTTLYALSTSGDVARTTDGVTWSSNGRVALPVAYSARSVAVVGSNVYVGTTTGHVYRAGL